MINEIDILKKLVSFDTQNFDDVSKISNTTPALDYIANILDQHKIRVEFQEYTRKGIIDGKEITIQRKNLIAKVHNRSDLPNIGFEGHIDTVPFGDYVTDPLGKETADKIYGRGVVDMTGSIAGMISAALQSKQSNKPNTDITLIITSDEEAHNFEGIKRYIENPVKTDVVICGEPTSMVVKDRFKGALYYIIEINGKSGHGSRQYEGENAIVKGIPVLTSLDELYHLIPTIKNVDFITQEAHSEESSMNIGYMIAGTKVNMIPDFMKIEFEMRLVYPAQKYTDLISEKLQKHTNLLHKVTQIFAKNPALANIAESNPFYANISQLSEGRFIALGFSEANILNEQGIPTIQYGVGNGSMAHSQEEYIEKKDLIEYTKKLINLTK